MWSNMHGLTENKRGGGDIENLLLFCLYDFNGILVPRVIYQSDNEEGTCVYTCQYKVGQWVETLLYVHVIPERHV